MRSLPLSPDLAKTDAIELKIEIIYLDRDYMEAIVIFILIGLVNGALQRTGEIVMDNLLDRG